MGDKEKGTDGGRDTGDLKNILSEKKDEIVRLKTNAMPHSYYNKIMIVGTAAAEIFAAPFSEMFGLSGETYDLCVSAMRVISAGFVFAGIAKANADKTWTVWLTFPIAETLTAVIAAALFIHIYKRTKSILRK